MKANLLLVPAMAMSLFSCRKDPRPNIVLILADDMGYGDMSCQNPHSKIITPNLDRLASQGVRFTDAHSASSVSSPSRYSILTGRYHWRGHLTSGIISQWGDPAIEKGRMTIASMLKEAGYRTACIGKWHLGEIWPFRSGLGQNDTSGREWSSISRNGTIDWGSEAFDWTLPVKEGPVTRGFDYYFGTGVINFPPYTWIENDKILEIPAGMLDLKDSKPEEGSWECRPGPAAKDWDIRKVPVRLLEKAVEWIDSRKDDRRPFFLYYALPSPHAPIIPSQMFRNSSEAGGFGDYVQETDWFAGEIMAALKRNGFEKNTMVIFTSDNGPEAYAYERIRNYDHFSMGDMRGLKRDLWEGGHRVPFVVRYPERIPAGIVCDKLFSHTDIMATIAAFTGSRLPDDAAEDSFDQTDLFLGQAGTESARDFIVYHSINGSFALRKDNSVLIEAPSAEVSREPEWMKQRLGVKDDSSPLVLYDLTTDPLEKHNLYWDDPSRVIELKKFLDSTRQAGRSVPAR